MRVDKRRRELGKFCLKSRWETRFRKVEEGLYGWGGSSRQSPGVLFYERNTLGETGITREIERFNADLVI